MLSQIYSDYAIVNKKLSQEFEQLKKMTVVTEFRKIFIQDYDFIIYRDYVVSQFFYNKSISELI